MAGVEAVVVEAEKVDLVFDFFVGSMPSVPRFRLVAMFFFGAVGEGLRRGLIERVELVERVECIKSLCTKKSGREKHKKLFDCFQNQKRKTKQTRN